MKLQLDEKKLNAYINEAIKQETNEGVWSRLANFATKKATKAAEKAAGKTAAKKATAKASREAAQKGAKTSIGRSVKTGKAARDVSSYNKALVRSGKVSKEEVKELKHLQKLQRQGKLSPEEAKKLRKLESRLSGKGYYTSRADADALIRAHGQQAAIAGGAAALGGGIALGASGGHKDDPWNVDGENGNGNSEGGNGNGGGFDGGFPWDNTEPVWTPKKPKTTTPATTPTQSQSQEQQPEQPEQQPERPKVEPIIAPVNANIPAPRVTGPQAPGLAKHETQPSIAQSAVRTMGQTANQSTLGLDNRHATNKRTKQNAINAINQAKKDDAMTKDQARNDKKLVRNAEKSLRKS